MEPSESVIGRESSVTGFAPRPIPPLVLSPEQREYAHLRRQRALEVVTWLAAHGQQAGDRASRLLRFVADLDEILATDSVNWN